MLNNFLSEINEFLYNAIVFFRIGWNSLPGTNTLAYYKNLLITDKKVLYYWALESVPIRRIKIK
jgi:hypothetical protein